VPPAATNPQVSGEGSDEMAQNGMSPAVVRWSGRLLASVALVAAVSGVVALLKPHVPALSLLVLYLLAVLPVAVLWGARLAAITSVVSVAAFALFVPPDASRLVTDSQNFVALGVFLVTAIVVAELAARSRRSAVESARLTREQSALRRVATLVAHSGPPAAVFEAVTREVGLLCSADLARMERYEADGTVTGVAAWSRGLSRLAVGTQFDLIGLSVARDVRRTGGPVRLESFVGAKGGIAREAHELGIRASVGCPIVVAGRLWGVIAASTNSDIPFPANTELQIASFTELVATAIENAEARAELRRMADGQAALRRVATLVARGAPSEALFASVAEEVGRLFDAENTAVSRYEAEDTVTVVGLWSQTGGDPIARVGARSPLGGLNVTTQVFETGQPARVDRYPPADSSEITTIARAVGSRSAVGAPISVEGRLWGSLAVASSHQAGLPASAEGRLAEFTEIVATAIANAENRAQLAASRARVVAAGDDMRRRLERDLHDGAQQRLVSLALELRLARDTVPDDLPGLRDRFGETAEELVELLDELREISRGLHPAILAEGGLGPALRTLARRSAVVVDLQLGTDSRYSAPVEVATYYVVSEALANASKHAGASQAEVSLEERGDTLRLRVSDDGIGGADPQGGSGLIGLRDRVEALGGSIDVVSPKGHGTVITVCLPIERSIDLISSGTP